MYAGDSQREAPTPEPQPEPPAPRPAAEASPPRLQAGDVRGEDPQAAPAEPRAGQSRDVRASGGPAGAAGADSATPPVDESSLQALAEGDTSAVREQVMQAGLEQEAGEGTLAPTHPSEQRRLPRLENKLQEEVNQIVAEAAAAFGLGPDTVDAEVHPDGGRPAAQGTRGMMDGGKVHLDGRKVDPESEDTRRLVGHEVAHAGQRGLPGMGDDPVGMAEAEAHTFGERFARGERTGPLQAGLPRGHVAREDGGGAPGGADVTGLLTQYQQAIDANSQTVTPPTGTAPAGASGNAGQDHARKVQRYTDGVDGIADQIGNLGAFDDLCDAYGTFGDGETSGPMSGIKGSGPYNELTRMWQGAKEGGEDSGAMRSAFNNEFDGRGFWGSTEQAFDLVQANAQADAQPEPEAGAARSELNNAEEGAEEAAEAAQEGEGEGAGAGGGPGGPGADGALSGPMADLMGADVPDEAPAITSFDDMARVTDEQLDALLDQARHQSSFSERAAGGEFESRGSQIMETLGENFLGSFARSGTDTLVDALVFDNIGFLADQGLKVITKGRLGTPMVGPLIGLIQEPPISFEGGFHIRGEAFGSEQFGSAFDNFANMGETWAAFDQAQDAGDYVGIFCALLADLFGGLRDLIDGIATFCGTLSAICYVVGGILILVGLALLWLAGVGAPLVTAGGWMTRVAGILGRINSALGPIVLALSALTTLFRTAAAFMVPAEMYANQLAGVGNAAGTFGEKAGAKAADMTAQQINGGWQEGLSNRVNDRIAPPDAGPDGGGGTDVDGMNQDLDDARAQVEADAAEAEAQRPRDGEGEEQRQGDSPESDEQRPRDGEEGEDQRPRDDDSPPSRARRILAAFERAPLVGEAVRAGRELVSAIGDPRRAAMEGLSPRLRADFDNLLDQRINDTQQRISTLQDDLRGINGPVDQADKARIEREIAAARQDIDAFRTHLDETRAAIAEAERNEQLARDDREREDDEPTRQDDLDGLRQQGEDLRARLEETERTLDTRRPEVQAEVQRLQDEIARIERERVQAQADLETAETDAHTAAETRRAELQADVDRILGDMDRLTSEADRLDRQAEAAERAQTLRQDADTAERNAETARTQAESHRATLEGHVGERIRLTDHEGTTQNGMISRRLVAVTDDGVIIAEGHAGTQRTVPFSDIRYPAGLRDAAAQYQEARTTAQDAGSTAQQHRTTADALAPEGTDPTALRDRAAAERTRAANMQGDWDAARLAAGGDTTPTENRTRVNDARAVVSGQDSEITAKQQAITDAQGEVTTLQGDVQRLQGEVRENRAAVEQAEQDARRAESAQAHHELAHQGSTGNATGGIGSSNAAWGEWLVRKTGLFDLLLQGVEACGGDAASLRAAEPGNQTTGAAVEQMVLGGAGITVETEEQLRAIGDRRAAIEQMLELTPPTDPATLADRRNAAIEAYEDYQQAHARAARAYQAEQAVGELAAGTEAMAQSGEPIVQRSQSMSGPLQQSRTDEEARTSQLGGGNEVQPSGEQAGGIVAELIMKLATHGDAMDEQPTPPPADAGNQVDSSQQTASTESTQRGQQSRDASGQQRAFLDAAIQARAQQEQQVSGDITTLQGKHQEELAIQREIQQQKAQALMEREQHRARVEQEAGAFNSDYQALQAWKAQYEAARRRVSGA